MDHTYLIFVFGAAFGIFVMIKGIVGAYREKDKRRYFTTTILGFLIFLTFVFITLNQPALLIISFASTAAVAIASFPRVARSRARKSAQYMTKLAQQVDASAPLRLRDFSRQKGC